MKRKKLKSKGAVSDAVAVVNPEPKREEAKEARKANTSSVIHLEFPPPDYLLEQARSEPNRKLLHDYRETIAGLRDEKGFSFREIAEWLTEHGVPADYNAVYRVYTKGMHPADVAELDRVTDQEGEEG